MAGIRQRDSYSERYVKPHPTPPAKSLAPPPKVPSRGGNVYTQARSQTFSGSSTPPTKPRPPPASRQPHGPPSVVPARPVHKSIPAPPTKSNGAPPVPPKRNSSSGRSFSVGDDYHQKQPETSDSGSVYRLVDFVASCGHLLPLRVRITEGFCGKDEQSVISAGDVYNFHFIKNETVVSFRLGEGRKMLSLPLNSSVQFGLLYNPSGETSRAMKGYTYRTVKDLAACKVLPHIVRATKPYNSGNQESSVEAEEVLIITGIERSTRYQMAGVKVLSLNTRKSKVLNGECEGYFVTDPASVRLYLTDIAELFRDKLPLKAILFPDSNMSEESLEHLASEVVSLNQMKVETSIIATTCVSGSCHGQRFSEREDEEEAIPVAIPADLKISLAILDDQMEDEELYADTRDLYSNFNPYNVQSMAPLSNSDSMSSVYMSLKELVRSGYEYQGLEIVRPAKIYSDENTYDVPGGNYEEMYMQSPSPSHLTEPSSVSKVDTSLANSSDTRALADQSTGNTSDKLVEQVSSHESLECEVEQLKSQLKLALSTIAELKGNYCGLKEELSQVKMCIENMTMESTLGEAGPEMVERNVEELKRLSCEQMQKLLMKMNLGCYSGQFSLEQVDGTLLSECDESILQDELSIPNSLHRRKLMKIITGKQSVRHYL